MNLKKFSKLISNLQASFERTDKINDLGLNLLDYDELYYNIIDDLLEESFTREGADWIGWYLHDRFCLSQNEPQKAFNKYGKEICYDIESLWKEVISANDK